ncbi:probable arginine--tRNA ligase, mitochondrial [Orussus abietinus]|uniref:probable arginine--tRNA ligase, mitochondrial n=1 Tax=Orussus abietinus TaxID=222816 RepID=UPI000625E57C|nr:probable arginine--tRNA ligase, mitochondrial [Orussus abietinus]
MSAAVRSVLHDKVAKVLRSGTSNDINFIASHLVLRLNTDANMFCFLLPLRTREYDVQNDIHDASHQTDDFVNNIRVVKESSKDTLAFEVPRNEFIKSLLLNSVENVFRPKLSNSEKKVVVEFSSPNIAKPFHVGHLRSTILGNYIANLNSFVQNDVKKINYLGDWGTQFGYVQLGIDLCNVSKESMEANPIKELYKAYVHANTLTKDDPTIADKAREIFKQLENGESENFTRWETYKKYTIEELQKIYARLGVTFDEYHWESTYNAKAVNNLISKMEQLRLLETDAENRKVVSIKKMRVPIIKSDGSTLYITRDIAAAIDRFNKYNFDHMYYVVDSGQTEHFNKLVEILKLMKEPWMDRLTHVKFGKIQGMSTRKGTAVFLDDFLDEMRNVMQEKQIQSPTTKVNVDVSNHTSDILGISAVIVNDFKQRRQKDYQFDWDTALDVKGDTGVKMQYVHCRLSNLEKNCNVKLVHECDPTLLMEPVVDEVALVLGKFEESVFKSYQTLEPCILTIYLFALCNVTNKAIKLLRVKGEPTDVASQRLLLFHACKNVLAQGMKLLGIQPLDKM